MSTEPAAIVEIAPHDPGWATEFVAIGARLRAALGARARRIDHIGSTSVAALAAKPIIDVQVSVTRFEPFAELSTALALCGYAWRADNPERTKRYFRETPPMRRTHVHVRIAGSWHEQWALLFRDCLRVSAADRDRYETVKQSLAVAHRHDRVTYTEAKAPIFWEIIARADRWAAATGWQPGNSDA